MILTYGNNSIVSPRPANGTASYIEYINTSLEYPETARNAQIEGVVLVKLTISSGGAINNIEIKKSLSNDCDQEAVRLIEEGPQWSPATFNGDPIEGSVRIRFIFKL
jgi:TonB family protein